MRKTPELYRRAQQLRAQGLHYKGIAAQLGLKTGTPVRAWLDPAYAALRNKRDRERRAGIHRPARKPRKATREALDAVALMQAIPPDTRDLTARLCGDPLPGRRAIDLKREMQPHPAEAPFQ